MKASAVAKWVRALAPQAEAWVFKSQMRRTEVEKPGSDSSTAKHLESEANALTYCAPAAELKITSYADGEGIGLIKNIYLSHLTKKGGIVYLLWQIKK